MTYSYNKDIVSIQLHLHDRAGTFASLSTIQYKLKSHVCLSICLYVPFFDVTPLTRSSLHGLTWDLVCVTL